MTDDRKAARVPHRRRSEPGRAVRGHWVGAKSIGRGGGTALAARCRIGEAAPPGTVTLEVVAAGPQGGVAVVRVSGEIDLWTGEQFRAGLFAVVEAGFGRIIVDFEGVRFCDATGLGALVAAYNRLDGSGDGLRLACVRPAQRRLFRITGLDRLFALHESVEEALREGRAPSTATQG